TSGSFSMPCAAITPFSIRRKASSGSGRCRRRCSKRRRRCGCIRRARGGRTPFTSSSRRARGGCPSSEPGGTRIAKGREARRSAKLRAPGNSPTRAPPMAIAQDSVVTIHYTLKDDAGEILDSSVEAEPLAYLHGHGNLVPGLERELEGKNVGDKISVTVQPQ